MPLFDVGIFLVWWPWCQQESARDKSASLRLSVRRGVVWCLMAGKYYTVGRFARSVGNVAPTQGVSPVGGLVVCSASSRLRAPTPPPWLSLAYGPPGSPLGSGWCKKAVCMGGSCAVVVGSPMHVAVCVRVCKEILPRSVLCRCSVVSEFARVVCFLFLSLASRFSWRRRSRSWWTNTIAAASDPPCQTFTRSE